MTDEHQGFVNGSEYRVFGLKRSGNHAVIWWILSQTVGEACFLGDAALGMNPYLASYDFAHWRDGRPVYRAGIYTSEDAERFLSGPYGGDARGVLRPKDVLLINYEDQPVSSIRGHVFQREHQRWVGRSRRRYNVLVLRDPFNLLASRAEAGPRLAADLSDEALISLWKEHAEWYRSPPTAGADTNVAIDFTRWHLSRSYRRAVAERLGLTFTDAGRRTVAPFLGSSFDGFAYDGQAHRMGVDVRWKTHRGSEPLARLRRDPTLMALAGEIFGGSASVREAMAD